MKRRSVPIIAVPINAAFLSCCVLLVTPVLRAGEPGPDILKQAGIGGGLVVQIGCDAAADLERLSQLRHSGDLLVEGLSTDPTTVARAREDIANRHLDGSVTVRRYDGKHLPYIDNLVNFLIASDLDAVPIQEVTRVLVPGGSAWIDGKVTVKPRPDTIDRWTHYLHGPGNNAVANDTQIGPPRYTQWIGDPVWTRNHHKVNSISTVVTDGGRLFYIVDEATDANMAVPGKWAIVARDAFNGKKLWEKDLPLWVSGSVRFRSGPPQVTRLLVVDGKNVYVPLQANAPISKLDARTGETRATYEETKGAEEIIVSGGTLLVLRGAPIAEQAAKMAEFQNLFRFPNKKIVVAVDLASGTTTWQWSPKSGDVRPETLASDGNRVYLQVSDGVVCLNQKDGRVAWTFGAPEKPSRRKMSFGVYTLVVHDDVVLCNLSGTVSALSAKDGHELWQRPVAPHGFHSPLDIFVIDGLVWLGTKRPDSVAPPAVGDFSAGLDLHTGEAKVTESVLAELQTAGHHHRCYREKATSRFILAGKRGIELVDLVGSDNVRNNWIRGTCQYGIMPANGLLYCPPTSCGCYMESLLHGFWSVASFDSAMEDPARVVPNDARLSTGVAFATAKAANTPTPDAGGWPTYRQNSMRSGVAQTRVAAKLATAWTIQIGGRLTQPVIQSNVVVVASIDRHTVHAIDARTGRLLWQKACGGRVDSSPTIHGDLVLFGSDDGNVTCLRLSDGAFVWRFLCAPKILANVAYDRLTSVWPVHGSVLVLDGVAYCSAGRSTWIDDGIFLYGLNPRTGAVLSTCNYKSTTPGFEQNQSQASDKFVSKIDQNRTDYKTFLQPDLSDAFSMAGGTRSDVLVSDGRYLFLHQVKFDRNLQQQPDMSRHLFSTSSLLDDYENHRSHWFLGTGDFSRIPVAYSWIVNSRDARRRDSATAVPYGVTLVFDDTAVWGVHRQGRADGNYTVFRRENHPFSASEPSLPDIRNLPKDAHPYPYVWSEPLTLRPRALLKSGDLLFLGATPTTIPADDPHAAYDGRLGGEIRVFRAKDGSQVASYPLASPVVWDGMAAANQRLYVSTTDGSVRCFSGQ